MVRRAQIPPDCPHSCQLHAAIADSAQHPYSYVYATNSPPSVPILGSADVLCSLLSLMGAETLVSPADTHCDIQAIPWSGVPQGHRGDRS